MISSRQCLQSPLQNKFREKLWTRLEPIVLILVSDVFLFLIVFAALVIAFTGISGLKALGMRPERLEILETLHWYAYLAVSILFSIDMLLKTILELLKAR
jgi:hypothetical protein